MSDVRELFPTITVGLDLGDRTSVVCEVNARAEVEKRASIATTRAVVRAYFSGRSRCRVVMEAGTHSAWVAREVQALGHEVVVGNPSEIYGPRRRKKRNDRTDAEFLARQGRADVKLLHPIQHRSAEAQQDLEMIRARDQLVQARTKLINHVRGAVKSLGGRIRKCSAEAFPKRAVDELANELRGALLPLLEVVDHLTMRISEYDDEVERVAKASYADTAWLQQPKGVGTLTALTYMLLVEDPKRFKDPRDVGAYFGLVPRLDDSSDSKPQLRITKAGDELGRRLLVSAAQYILGPHGPDCDLRRYGQKIAQRGGKNAKKRAAVAVARKLAVLLLRLWVSRVTYDPDHLLKRQERKQRPLEQRIA